jgi:hypothetical protein
MAETGLNRIRVTWTGIPSGNGVSTFYSQSGTVPNLSTLRLGLANLSAILPTGVTLQIENQGDSIETDGGAIDGSWSTSAQAAVVGAAGGAYASPTGAVITWLTDEIHGRRHLKGRTFFVPLAASAYGSNGSLLAGATTALQGVGNGLLAAGTGAKYCVWGRPVRPKGPDGKPVPGSVGTGGMGGIITSYKVPTKAMVLTSRRD